MSNPPTVTANTSRGAQVKDDNGYPTGFLYRNITDQSTTVVKSGAGFLHTITLNKPTATTTIALYDNTAASGSAIIGTITIPASPQPSTLTFDVAFATGLTVLTGTANSDITISYV